jgi:hypothetical protein
MSKSAVQKLVLENFIYWRAACLATTVNGVGGRLTSPSKEPYLQVSIFLYNACFAVAVCEDKIPAPGCVAECAGEYAGGLKNGWALPVWRCFSSKKNFA